MDQQVNADDRLSTSELIPQQLSRKILQLVVRFPAGPRRPKRHGLGKKKGEACNKNHGALTHTNTDKVLRTWFAIQWQTMEVPRQPFDSRLYQQYLKMRWQLLHPVCQTQDPQHPLHQENDFCKPPQKFFPTSRLLAFARSIHTLS